ncbi:MAG: ECF-type sigma factor [Gemmataceae bacterium]
MTDLTRLLDAADAGDPHAAAELLPLVYDELRRLAAAKLAGEANHSLNATSLVHEAYLRLVSPAKPQAATWANRRHFFAAAATAMRRILVDAARARNAASCGGGRGRGELADVAAPEPDDDVVALDEALDRLATRPVQGRASAAATSPG